MAALLLILTSCVDDLYPGTSGPVKLLGMDADLYTTDTLHEVMLYYSGYDSIEYAGDLTVSIYVNGELRDETSDCRPYYDKTSDYLKYPALYDLRATFSPGDKVRIVARMKNSWTRPRLKFRPVLRLAGPATLRARRSTL